MTDLRTWVSGIKAADLMGAPTFEEVQKQVAAIVQGKILVGHAVMNDLKVGSQRTRLLVLGRSNADGLLGPAAGSPWTDAPRYSEVPCTTRTSEIKIPFAAETHRARARRQHTEGVAQFGELAHPLSASGLMSFQVTDARATMALYRLYKNTWEASLRHSTEAWMAKSRKRRKSEEAQDGEDDSGSDDTEANGTHRGGDDGRKRRKNGELRPQGKTGVSSGLGKIVKIGNTRIEGKGERRNTGAHGTIAKATGDKWWET